MMQRKNAQVSFEFIMIFGLALLMIALFTYLINERLSEINKDHDMQMMKNLANSIKSEVLLAASVNNNYLRRFSIPEKLNGLDYRMSISEDSLTIQTFDKNNIIAEYFTIFPTHVKGNFVDDIGYNNTEHCITKNSFDGIRISRNQISLDPNSTTTAGNIPVTRGDIIEVLVSLNCVKNIRSTQFTIKYDPAALRIEVDRSMPITYSEKELNPLFEDVNVIDYEGIGIFLNNTNYPYINGTQGRYTFGVIGKKCATGSGNIAKLYFTVIGNPGTTNIEFEPLFGDSNLVVLDCETNKNTVDDIPDSKKGAEIEIN